MSRRAQYNSSYPPLTQLRNQVEAPRTSAVDSSSEIELLRVREAALWRRYKSCAAIAGAMLAIIGLLSTRTVERMFPDNFPNWASATLVVGLIGGGLIFGVAAGVFLKQRNSVNRQLAMKLRAQLAGTK
jgi:hypothetical protein